MIRVDSLKWVFTTSLLAGSVYCGLYEGDNYPANGKPKPCTPVKTVVNYVEPICIPDEKNEWRPESAENCRTAFRETCPEFNEGECMWYDWTPKDPAQAAKLGNKPLQIPCCRLKYYAKIYPNPSKTTWMEVFYTNQYGTWDSDKTVFDIVEIHRLVKAPQFFGNVAIDDWPNNVVDSNGERGLTWTDLEPKKISLVVNDICAPGKDQKAAFKSVTDYLKAHFADGFDSAKLPKLSGQEKEFNKTIMFNRVASCSVALIGGAKKPVCKVIFTRQSQRPPYYFTANDAFETDPPGPLVPYLEAQLYNADKATPGSPLKLRYAYYNYEMPY